MARVGKLFGKAPSDYFLMDDGAFWFSLDLACAAVYWEDEGNIMKDSNNLATSQATEIGRELEAYREKLNQRG